ncbi:SNF1-related protein kinase catalytic subunit alpha KIN10-like [Actinidia eriantha]|uniref:SNF1-related protein kinase catalytic subunit alpha KIN10-like n=1 Tax=Actinidia eriantha TaxID=165200 RepID=UPI002584B1BD|nr:SNF1-related protein kinase catalytic subunit alpha KIN10-like [Actinidia eriantha]XP_057486789.1 SNF1-related protein kinase catalytic subunit alpha KIN10-like [Actinidia eriantha]XP_057486797.1 SNF1-related protein kinase catalytic subunit alpha KIN10-like [Actinidia eriantha]
MDGSARASSSPSSSLSNYRVGKTLGIGAFGKVKLALHILTGIKVAIKILDRQSINVSEAEKVRREINNLRLFSHPHIVRLYEVIETRHKIYVVMEYMNAGELFDYITENGRLKEDEARHFFQQIISGVECCHLHMVVHRDLKPENLLLDLKRNIKIADFGLSNIMRDGHFLRTNCGSPNYAAPEVISKKLYAGPEVDIWSCGVILYALLCGRLPFDDDNLPGLCAKINNGVYTFPNHLSHGARDLISRILIVDPITRLSIPEIRQHPWFQLHIPRYLVTHSVTATYGTRKIEEDIVLEVAKMGFDVHKVIESLQNGMQNEATLTYYLLSDKRFSVHHNCLKNELVEPLIKAHDDHPEIYLRPLSADQRKWALGFQSQASPRETMTDVLKILHKLNVRWKEIGHYNMKCLWLPLFSSRPNDTLYDSPTQLNYNDDLDLSISCPSRVGVRLQNAVRFEIQLYKASEESYLLDLQMIHGPPFLFLEICAAFFASVVA